MSLNEPEVLEEHKELKVIRGRTKDMEGHNLQRCSSSVRDSNSTLVVEAAVAKGTVIENLTEIEKDLNLQMESLPAKIKRNPLIVTFRED